MNYKKFRLLRLGLKLRQDDVAKALGVSRVAVSNWELGKAEPKCGHLQQVAKILGCKIDELFTESKVN